MCSVGTCPIDESYYGYVPNLGINIFYAIVFGLVVLTCLVFLAVFRRSWLAYTIVLSVGATLEAVGYVLRSIGHSNPFDENPWVIQLIFLTISPVFMSAS